MAEEISVVKRAATLGLMGRVTYDWTSVLKYLEKVYCEAFPGKKCFGFHSQMPLDDTVKDVLVSAIARDFCNLEISDVQYANVLDIENLADVLGEAAVSFVKVAVADKEANSSDVPLCSELL
ncbi:TPA: hypothetical protein DDW69_03715 [candidate division CPR2 bacterium]|uniref:Uncharacterized protein n=1 Tax=candidate division CPR2 bacterium GW2011_GWC1_41_48 TaxID=1618344 RepID=A0A0G0Z7H7_UNCC2|nr:MAG: hypothetical protein UT47_C0003G0064 [candidate division CPR2 bacterium GW2011_GWC2_39_35]KKR29348.1 MAG: hypothetical protein UT60_C0003G0025 [candidate division CPR2 bacterium GW2011_GWD2_39_7]KKS09003.1 MAG: hypothetical protein UU65_C0003G0058 [candidate division CPR2 bacterium GW2011_GWC1_41_48]OGB71170.1 MAG: hypothetical protein A2Y26_04130 [candidate division CPR2 bacterium GWD2_39_7]HBG81922.1 hypothetical protein [candidate division CPR2 bacterium]